MPLAAPPENTNSVPLRMVPIVLPSYTYWVPSLLTMVPLAVPPEDTYSSPSPSTVVPLAVPPENT